MKNYVIMLLAVCLVLSISYAYKWKRANDLHHFPIEDIEPEPKDDAVMFLVLSFYRDNCKSCMGIIEKLNGLGDPFVVCGIVPDEELANEKELREYSRAEFKLFPQSRFRNVIPLYTPSLLGVSAKGRIMFILPGAPGQVEYFDNFLYGFYPKALETLKM